MLFSTRESDKILISKDMTENALYVLDNAVGVHMSDEGMHVCKE